ncbi:MAG: hypothetical protein HYR56_15815 [Acidobacteria bacterium]|nr:hypothetical protein [Acidobacteriota bacterium]MBI3425292.1 hypothetical protein [Acidobacteriota bacterium]
MTEDSDTQELSDRELLLLLHRGMGELNGRMERLEAKAYDTQPLPANFDARFTVLENRIGGIEDRLGALEDYVREIRRDVSLLRDDIFNERRERADLASRVAMLETRPS